MNGPRHAVVRHPDLAVVAFGAAWEVRPDWSTEQFSTLAEAVVLDVEVREALIRLWDRHHRGLLTRFERDVLAAILDD